MNKEKSMSTDEHTEQSQSQKLRFPRWLTPVYFGVLIPLALIVAP
jgi:hypothetical protein